MYFVWKDSVRSREVLAFCVNVVYYIIQAMDNVYLRTLNTQEITYRVKSHEIFTKKWFSDWQAKNSWFQYYILSSFSYKLVVSSPAPHPHDPPRRHHLPPLPPSPLPSCLSLAGKAQRGWTLCLWCHSGSRGTCARLTSAHQRVWHNFQHTNSHTYLMHPRASFSCTSHHNKDLFISWHLTRVALVFEYVTL